MKTKKGPRTSRSAKLRTRIPIPDDVREAAKRGLALKDKGYTGARDLGISRGHQLAKTKTVSVKDLQVMRAWYARHVVTSYPSYARWKSASDEERDKKNKWNGTVAWLLWGGTPGYYWVLSNENQQLVVQNGEKHHKHLKPHVHAVPNLIS